ncbi:serine protease 40-like [Lynx rufus]|uniref:serine protease 40-like n=1 Tax=Lynx rufus TaxID=61384 RepID=UPI001F127042|nr:serine protease 40-like [Lynx rufus]
MASARAEGSGPGWQGACVLATALLWLCPLLLRAEPEGTAADVCGKPAVTGKIFGGQNAPDRRWPWQASLLYHGKHICGAALIDAYWVISAAHCFQKSHEPSDYQVLLGYHQLQHPTEHSRQMTVYRVIVHNDFNKRYYMGSDIALLQLHLSVNFTSHILPACLPGPTMKLPLHSSCWITGWGMITEDDFLAAPFQLQEGEVGIIDSEVCKMYFQSPDSSSSEYSIHEDMFCAGDLMTGKSICRGDSGGPLVCKLNGGTWFLMGLSSWSQACRYPIGPSVFTRLTYFSHWISEKRSTLPNPDPSCAPSQDKPPILSDFSSLGTVHKPSTCITLVSLQTFLLLLIFLRIL